jgi:hypothetical protein
MVRFYIDLETCLPREEDTFIDEKIILGGLLIDETPYSEHSLNENVESTLVTEWDGLEERSIVTNLQNYVKDALRSHKFTVICGYNFLHFDIPLLICKSLQYSLGTAEVLSKMWNECYARDYFQQLLTANRNLFKGLELRNVVHVASRFDLKPPPYSASSGALRDLYDQHKWKEIEKHHVQGLKVIRWLDLYGAKQLIKISVKNKRPLFCE